MEFNFFQSVVIGLVFFLFAFACGAGLVLFFGWLEGRTSRKSVSEKVNFILDQYEKNENPRNERWSDIYPVLQGLGLLDKKTLQRIELMKQEASYSD